MPIELIIVIVLLCGYILYKAISGRMKRTKSAHDPKVSFEGVILSKSDGYMQAGLQIRSGKNTLGRGHALPMYWINVRLDDDGNEMKVDVDAEVYGSFREGERVRMCFQGKFLVSISRI